MSISQRSVRAIEIEDCAGVVKLIRSCYGDTYGVDYFYDLDALISEIESGRLRSVVALKDKQIVGHMALLRQHPQAKVCEMGNTVVHDSARGEGLMMQLAECLRELALENGFTGYVHYPTTPHPIMQKASVSHGGVETGLMLGFIAADSDDQQSGPQKGRLAATVAYQSIARARARNLQRLPVRYAEFLANLYKQLKLSRQIAHHPSLPLQNNSSFTSHFNPLRRCLQVDVEKNGRNLADELQVLINQHQPCVSYIDLPVDSNGIDQVIEHLNKLGFFYAALLPDFAGSDILRLQKLSPASSSDFQPKLANEPARKLLKFIQGDACSAGAVSLSTGWGVKTE